MADLLPAQEYADKKLPYVKTEYGVHHGEVFLAVKNLWDAQDLVDLIPEAVIVYRSVSEWLALD